MTTLITIRDFALRYLAAIIYLQTLWFKFSAHPDSVYIFSRLGLEPYGRILLGVLELVTAVLLIVPRTAMLGTLMSLAIISGAIASHLGPLGISVQGDGGKVFYLAVAVCAMNVLYLMLHINGIRPAISNLFKRKV